jgi:hypothetical protein
MHDVPSPTNSGPHHVHRTRLEFSSRCTWAGATAEPGRWTRQLFVEISVRVAHSLLSPLKPDKLFSVACGNGVAEWRRSRGSCFAAWRRCRGSQTRRRGAAELSQRPHACTTATSSSFASTPTPVRLATESCLRIKSGRQYQNFAFASREGVNGMDPN